MIIKVTQEHIDKGITCSTAVCPVALAVIDKLKELNELKGKGIYVTKAFIWIDDDEGSGGTYNLPAEARNFIEAFDSRYEVQPFEFEISYEV